MKTVPDDQRILGIEPEQAATDAARSALQQRLDAVDAYVPLAAPRFEDDTEHVDHLLLATRHAMVALRAFEPMLPRRRTRELGTEVRRLGRKSGIVVDLNVLAVRLTGGIEPANVPPALGRAVIARRAALRSLGAAHDRWIRQRVTHRISQVVKRVRWRDRHPEPDFATAGRLTISRSANDFLNVCALDLREIAFLSDMQAHANEFHQLLALFAGTFDSTTRNRLHLVFEQLLEKLDAVLEHATARTLFTKWTGGTADGLERDQLNEILTSEERLIQDRFGRFHDWWSPHRLLETTELFDRLLAF